MKPVIFIGAERVGKAVLESLLKKRKNIVAVFTAHPSLKEKIADFVDYKDLEKKYPKVDFYYIRNSRNISVVKDIAGYKPEVILVVSWSQIIPPEILKIPKKGVVGLHYSLLPKRRGGAPLNWAIIEGLRKSGITLFYMDEKLDHGDIIAQRKFNIRGSETVKDLIEKIEAMAPPLILQYFDLITNGRAISTKQDGKIATYTKRRTPKDSIIDWSLSLEKIYNFIRALVFPYPPAFFKIGNKKVYFTAVEKLSSKKLRIEGYITDEN